MKQPNLFRRLAPLLMVLAVLTGCTTPTSVAVLPTVAVIVATMTPPAATNTATAEPATATAPPSPTNTATTAPATPTSQSGSLTALQNANLRGGPDTTYEIVGSLNAGDQADVVGRDASGNWLVVQAGGKQGWIARALVAFSGDVNALSVVAAPPTPRPVATLTQQGTATARAAPPLSTGGARGLTATLQMCGGKTTFAAGTERICFIETIRNPTSAPVQYGILGVLATNTVTGATQFQSSWSAFTGPLVIDPGCTGPTDRCGGPWEDGMYIATPGIYRLTLNICFTPTIEGCASGGDWVTLTPGIEIVVQ